MRAFLFLFLLFSIPAYSQVNEVADEVIELLEEVAPDHKLNKAQLRRLQSELKIQKIIIKGVSNIHHNGVDFVDIDKATNTVDEILKNVIDEKTKYLADGSVDFADDSARRLLASEVSTYVSKGKIKTALKSVGSKLSDLGILAKSSLRNHGVMAGVAYIIGSAINWGVPAILIAKQQYVLANIVIAAPVATMTTSGYLFIEKLVKRKRLVRALGGADIVKNYKVMQKKVRKALGFSKSHELFDLTTVEGRTFTVSVENQGILSKIKQKFGYNKELNFKNLDELFTEKGITSTGLDAIRESKLPGHIKTIKMIHYLNENGSNKEMQIVMNKFSSFINEVDYLPRYSQARTWALLASSSKSFEELYGYMRRIPVELPPLVVKDLWFDFILPEASKNIDFSFMSNYNAFRALFNDNQIKGELFDTRAINMTEELQERFNKYLHRNIPNAKICDLNLSSFPIARTIY
jgi:hypothetical protein